MGQCPALIKREGCSTYSIAPSASEAPWFHCTSLMVMLISSPTAAEGGIHGPGDVGTSGTDPSSRKSSLGCAHVRLHRRPVPRKQCPPQTLFQWEFAEKVPGLSKYLLL